MNPKYKDQYRNKSNRLQNWDYSWVGYYFITIATKNREHYFGEIQNQKMNLSTIGKVAKTEWLNTPNIRPDMNIVIDEFCIMPNHFHAIINIGQNQYNQRQHRGYAMHRISTTPQTITKNKFGPQRKNLSSIVRGFKSAITTYTRKNNIEFAWQTNYHDHIIRNDDELHRIREYIINNPQKWTIDKQNKP